MRISRPLDGKWVNPRNPYGTFIEKKAKGEREATSRPRLLGTKTGREGNWKKRMGDG